MWWCHHHNPALTTTIRRRRIVVVSFQIDGGLLSPNDASSYLAAVDRRAAVVALGRRARLRRGEPRAHPFRAAGAHRCHRDTNHRTGAYPPPRRVSTRLRREPARRARLEHLVSDITRNRVTREQRRATRHVFACDRSSLFHHAPAQRGRWAAQTPKNTQATPPRTEHHTRRRRERYTHNTPRTHSRPEPVAITPSSAALASR